MSRDIEAWKKALKEAQGSRSQNQAAEKAGVSSTGLAKWKKGKFPTDPEDVRRIADLSKYPRFKLIGPSGYRYTKDDREWDEIKFPHLIDEIAEFVSLEGEEDRTDHGSTLSQEPSMSIPNPSWIGSHFERLKKYEDHLAQIGPMVDTSALPIQGSVPCGPPEHQDEVNTEYLDLSETLSLVLADGSSMLPYYENGDLIVMYPCRETLKRGEKFIVWINGEVTCKILESWEEAEGESWVTFEPANHVYPRMRVLASDCYFQGVAFNRIDRKRLRDARIADPTDPRLRRDLRLTQAALEEERNRAEEWYHRAEVERIALKSAQREIERLTKIVNERNLE